MDSDHIKRRQKELSKQQAIFVAARERGVPKKESAIMAGYKVGDSGRDVLDIEKGEAVQRELAKAREAMAKNTGLTREDVLAGLKSAAEMASTMADPQAMVRAWSEIGKMLGFYEPEKKKVTHELGKATLEALKTLPDSELLKLAKGRVIEGEFKEVPDDGPDEDL